MPNKATRYLEDAETDEVCIDEEQDNVLPLNIPDAFQRISVDRFDLTVRDLWDRYAAHNLELQPDFQRNYVWDDQKASRYIESLLLALPTPPVFVAEETNGVWTVIDGHQRLASVFRFMRLLLAGPAGKAGVRVPWAALEPLVLGRLEIMKGLNGKNVTGINPADRERLLWQAHIPVVKLGNDCEAGMKYALFARLNLGALSLNNQELRNCLYRGPYNDCIMRLSDGNGRYLRLWKRDIPDKRMKDRERVLRFFAFLHRMNEYSPPLREFLNKEMAEYQAAPPSTLSAFESELISALDWVERVFGDKAFKQYKSGDEKKYEGHWVKFRYDLIADVELVCFAHFQSRLASMWAQADGHERDLFKRLLLNRLVGVMTRDTFVDSINEGTMRPAAVRARFDPWFHTLEYFTSDPNRTLAEANMLVDTRLSNGRCPKCQTTVPEEEAVLHSIAGVNRVSHIYCSQSQH